MTLPDIAAATALDALDLLTPLRWPEALALLALLAACSVIVLIDWRHRIIPDACNGLVAALGLSLAATGGATAAAAAALQGAAAFVALWLVRALYRAVRSVPGLGLGDVKFLGAASIWIGLAGLPTLILIACTGALAFVAVQWWRGVRITARHAVPFGPFLVLGFVSVVVGSIV